MDSFEYDGTIETYIKLLQDSVCPVCCKKKKLHEYRLNDDGLDAGYPQFMCYVCKRDITEVLNSNQLWNRHPEYDNDIKEKQHQIEKLNYEIKIKQLQKYVMQLEAKCNTITELANLILDDNNIKYKTLYLHNNTTPPEYCFTSPNFYNAYLSPEDLKAQENRIISNCKKDEQEFKKSLKKEDEDDLEYADDSDNDM